MPAGRELNFKLYIEGIEVPFVNIQVQATANTPSQAQISMVPTDSIYNIRPRSIVHIFFFDDYIGPLPFGQSNQNAGVWRLLWEGEVTGLSFNKSSDARTVNLKCADMSNYWVTCKNYFLTAKQFGITSAKRTTFIGAKKFQLHVLDPISPYYAKFIAGREDFPQVLVNMIKGFTKDLVYWETLDERIRLTAKIDLIQDEEVKTLLEVTQSINMANGMFGNLGGRVSLLDFVNQIKELVYYTHIPIIAPPFKAKSETGERDALTSFLFKPNLYMTTPPRCNVFFPDQISSISFDRDFMNEPTRLMMATNHMFSTQGNDLTQKIFIAPSEIADSLNAGNISFNQMVGRILSDKEKEELRNRGISVDANAFYLTEEELEKGIIPIDSNLPFAKYSTLAESNEKINENLRQVAEYQLQLARFANRSLSVAMEFNPWVVLNFPCAVFDSSRSYFANVANITHTIDSTGGAFTHISCNLAREIVVDDEEIPTLPKWLNRRYHPDRVGGVGGTYATILGCDALSRNDETSSITPMSTSDKKTKSSQFVSGAENQFDIAKIADGVYQLKKPSFNNTIGITGEYDAIGSGGSTYDFARSYQRRNVATIEEVFSKHYKLGVVGSEEAPVIVPVGSAFEPTEGGGQSFFNDGRKPISGTPFDYRPNQGALPTGGQEGTITTKRRRDGVLIGNLDRPGHKRDAPIAYRKDTKDTRAFEGT